MAMGLHVASPTGQLIRETKTWILRCYACFHTTPHVEKKFCPKCGNKTLKRVSVTVNADGSQKIHISTRRPLNPQGKKFSLPKPHGGKHAVNPVMCEDQQFARQHKTKMARAKTNPLDPDYTCGKRHSEKELVIRGRPRPREGPRKMKPRLHILKKTSP